MIHTRLYNNISEMPMHNFIQCLIKGDLSYMKKSKGFIKNSKLKDKWAEIFDDYSEKSGDNTKDLFLSPMKEYTILVNKIKIIDSHLEILSIGYNQSLADNMKKIGYPVIDIKNREEYLKQLKRISTKAKTLVFNANKIKSEIDSFNDNKGSSEIKEEDFFEIFAILSKNQGYKMDPKNTTVLEFVTVINLSKKQSENGK